MRQWNQQQVLRSPTKSRSLISTKVPDEINRHFKCSGLIIQAVVGEFCEDWMGIALATSEGPHSVCVSGLLLSSIPLLQTKDKDKDKDKEKLKHQ